MQSMVTAGRPSVFDGCGRWWNYGKELRGVQRCIGACRGKPALLQSCELAGSGVRSLAQGHGVHFSGYGPIY